MTQYNSEMFKISEAAKALRMPYETLRSVAHSGRIRTTRCGKIKLISRPDLIMWARSNNPIGLQRALDRGEI